MSSIQLQGNSSGTGVMNVSSPNTNTNYTITLPQANTTLVGTDATQTLTNKTITDTVSLEVDGNAFLCTTSGNVGIGTSTPNSYLTGAGAVVYEASGDAQFVASTGATINAASVRLYNSTTPQAEIAAGGSAYGAWGGANSLNILALANNGPITFNTNNAGSVGERMRIIPTGTMYLGYGGAAPLLSGADVQGLSLTSNANVQLQMYMIKAAQVECHIGFKSSTDTNFYVGTAGGISGIGTYGLYQTNTGSTWTSVSDERFKTELQPIENALDKIANVRAVTGRYTYDEENGRTSRRPFLIAQDFVEALPEAVDQQDPDKLGLSYTDTIPLLVAAIKEQQELITSLTARIEALESKG